MTKKTKLWLPLLVAMLMIATVVVAACAKTATVTYAKGADGATGTAPAAQEVALGDEIELISNPFEYEGHTFAGWSDGSKTYQVGAKYKVEGDVTFTALWTEDGGSEEHKCGHECGVCHKCTDTSCTDPACADKCQGHEIADDHKCDNACSECGKCLTPNCNHKDCTDKCQGHEQPAEPFVNAPFNGVIGSMTSMDVMSVLSFNDEGNVFAMVLEATNSYGCDAKYTIAKDGTVTITDGGDTIGTATIVGNVITVTITLPSDEDSSSKQFTFTGEMYEATLIIDGDSSDTYIAEGTPLYLLVMWGDDNATVKVNGNVVPHDQLANTKMPKEKVTIEVTSPEEPKPVYHKVTFKANGEVFATKDVEHGQTVTAPETNPTHETKTFRHWSDGNGAFDFTTPINSDLELEASFGIYVTFDIDGATGTAPEAMWASPAGNVYLPDDSGFSKEGYTFGGWTDGE